jgi:drug/metabolite transporter (DMT)-like permease
MLAADGGLLLAALFWGFSFAVMKEALETFPTFWLLALRFNAAFIILCVFLGHRLTRESSKLYSMGIVSGLLLFAGYGAQTFGLTITTSSKQAFITSIYVVFVPLFTWIITRVLPRKFHLLSAFLCCLGMWMLTSEDVSAFNIGDAFTILCAVIFAAHVMYVGYATRIVSPVMLAVLQIGVTGILSLIFALLFSEWPGLHGTDGLYEIGFLAIFPTIGAFMLQNISQKYTSSTHAAIIISLESVFGVFTGVLALGEPFTFQMGIGCVVIFFAVMLSELVPLIFPREACLNNKF